MQEEINRLNGKNNEIQQTLEKERAAYAQDKKLLEDTIIDITTSEANSRCHEASPGSIPGGRPQPVPT